MIRKLTSIPRAAIIRGYMSVVHSIVLPVLAASAYALAEERVAAAPACIRSRVVPTVFIDTRSGPFANAGESSLRHFRAAFVTINARGGAAGYRAAGKILCRAPPELRLKMFPAWAHCAHA